MRDKHAIYGIRSVLEAIAAQQPINKIFIQKGLQGPLFKELEKAVHSSGLGFSYVPIEKLNRMAKGNHQGVVAQIAPVAFHDFEAMVEKAIGQEGSPLLLLLDQVTDVRNFGAIIRTAECCGVQGIIVPKTGSAPITEDTVKTSAGAAFTVPLAKVDHLKDAIYYLQASGINVVAATEKADQEIYGVDFDRPTALVMGSEEKGISPSILQIVDQKAKLPLRGDIGSLNVSVACGVFLYEVVRQRRK